jgi:hypothetical protein
MTLKEKREHVRTVLMAAARLACLEIVARAGYSALKLLLKSDETLDAGLEEYLWFRVNHWAKQAYKIEPFQYNELERRAIREGQNTGRFFVREFDKLLEAEFGADCLG